MKNTLALSHCHILKFLVYRSPLLWVGQSLLMCEGVESVGSGKSQCRRVGASTQQPPPQASGLLQTSGKGDFLARTLASASPLSPAAQLPLAAVAVGTEGQCFQAWRLWAVLPSGALLFPSTRQQRQLQHLPRCPQAARCSQPHAGCPPLQERLCRMVSHFLMLLVPAGLFCSNFLSDPLLHRLMVEPSLLNCTQPSQKGKKTPPNVRKWQPGLSSTGQAGEFVLPLVPHLLPDEEAAGGCGQPGAVAGRRYTLV